MPALNPAKLHNMRIEDIHIGDLVQVRDWDELAYEFGLVQDGFRLVNGGFISTRFSVNTKPFKFKQSMEKFCGEVYRVTAIDYPRVCLKVWSSGPIPDSHFFTADMLTNPWSQITPDSLRSVVLKCRGCTSG